MYKCKQCDGKGYINFKIESKSIKEDKTIYINGKQLFKKNIYIPLNSSKLSCYLCNGTGKVDWIENILGSKQDYIVFENYDDYQNYINRFYRGKKDE